MSGFDNLFDTAISRADGAIRSTMGVVAVVTSGVLAGRSITGVFDDPEHIGYATSGVRVEGVTPSFFIKSEDACHLQRLDTLTINGVDYWVDRTGPDDCGSRYLWLGTGIPQPGNRRKQEGAWGSRGLSRSSQT